MNNGRPVKAAWAGNAYEKVRIAPPGPLALRRDGLEAYALRDNVAKYCPEISALGEINGFVAGGFLRDTILCEEPRDLDVYIRDVDGQRTIENQLRSAAWQLEDCSPGVRTWRHERGRVVQLIDTDSRHPGPCLSRFDLTICCVALDLYTNDAVCGVTFLEHTKAKRLAVHNPAYPADTLRRIGGFLERGYSISGAELKKLHGHILADMHAQGMRAYRFREVA